MNELSNYFRVPSASRTIPLSLPSKCRTVHESISASRWAHLTGIFLLFSPRTQPIESVHISKPIWSCTLIVRIFLAPNFWHRKIGSGFPIKNLLHAMPLPYPSHEIQASAVGTLQSADFGDSGGEEPRIFVFSGHIDGIVDVRDATVKCSMAGIVLEWESRSRQSLVEKGNTTTGSIVSLMVLLFATRCHRIQPEQLPMETAGMERQICRQTQGQRLILRADAFSGAQRQTPCEYGSGGSWISSFWISGLMARP
jgi:hypothetical protein